MKTNTGSSLNSIPTNIIKLFKKELSKHLSDIINMSFNQAGVFPNILKIANVGSLSTKMVTRSIVLQTYFPLI